MNKDFQHLPLDKKVYIASDFHLGAPDQKTSLIREKTIIRWLDRISQDATLIILAGDLFDFWFEYKQVIPKGFIRFIGKLAALRDKGIPIVFFAGNHDMWFFDYFPEELGITIIRDQEVFQFGQKTYFIGHGDGIGPGDRKYKLIKHFFRNGFFQWLFEWVHPNIGVWLAKKWSRNSRKKNCAHDDVFLGKQEMLFQYCESIEAKEHHDYYIFGHRHLPIEMLVNETAQYINLGEWMNHQTYVQIDAHGAKLLKFED